MNTVAIETGAAKANSAFKKTFDSVQSGAANANQSLNQLDRTFSQTTQKMSSNNKIQQLGYQIGDFAVQVQGGTSVLTAFVQQGSQIAGAFGPWGAAIGAAGAVVGGLIGYLAKTGEASKEVKDRLAELTTQTDSYKNILAST